MPLAKMINGLVPFANIIATALMSALALQLILSSFVWLPYRPICGSVLLVQGLLLASAFFFVGRSQLDSLEASLGKAPRSVAPLNKTTDSMNDMTSVTS